MRIRSLASPVRGASRRVSQRRLRLESLEARQMLDAAGDALPLTRFESGEALSQYLLNDALKKYEGLFGQPTYGGCWGGALIACPMYLDAMVPMAGGAEVRNDHSTTNTQVTGVDEADVIENDGDYLYILSRDEVVIVDAWPADGMSVASRVPIDGQPFAEFLQGDRLAVLSHVYPTYADPATGGDVRIAIWPGPVYNPLVQVTMIDVSDRAGPHVMSETRFDGAYSDARAIGDNLYVISHAEWGLPRPATICTPIEDKPDDPNVDPAVGDDGAVRMIAPIWWNPTETCVYETREAYLARVAGHELDLGLPHVTNAESAGLAPTTIIGTVGTGTGTGTGTMGTITPTTGGAVATRTLLTQPTDVYRPRTESDYNLVSVTTFDLSGNQSGVIASTSVPTTYTAQVYASTSTLYLANPDWGSQTNTGPATALLAFDFLADGRVELVASGNVPGQALNQFSLDEYGGHLRIATTQGWGTSAINAVYVLQQTGQSLETIGSIVGMAPGERIFAVRFVGDRGYVVTFVQTDPLFALDLSDPTNPQVTGELHIPGFSNYLQPADAGHLIGIGRNADATGRAQELQVSLFDVTDETDPRLADRYSINVGQWAWSEATTDHHAVGFYPGYDVLAIPVTNGSGWGWVDRDGDGTAEFYSYRPLTDLWVFKLDLDATASDGATGDVSLLGRVQHDGTIRRSTRINDVLYAISDNAVSAHPILDPTTTLGRVHFGQEPVGVTLMDGNGDPVIELAEATPETMPPVVTGAVAGSAAWSREVVNFIEESAPTTVSGTGGGTAAGASSALGWSNVNQIKLTFSEDVAVGSQDLRIDGITVANYEVLGFAYDAGSRTAVWTLATPLANDRVTITLADSVTDRAGQRLDGNHDGVAGGTFKFTLTSLPGDVNRDGVVDRTDLTDTMLKNFHSVGDAGFELSADVDGDGRVTMRDALRVRDAMGTLVPAAPPAPNAAIAVVAAPSTSLRVTRTPRVVASTGGSQAALEARPRRLSTSAVDAAIASESTGPSSGSTSSEGRKIRARRGTIRD